MTLSYHLFKQAGPYLNFYMSMMKISTIQIINVLRSLLENPEIYKYERRHINYDHRLFCVNETKKYKSMEYTVLDFRL